MKKIIVIVLAMVLLFACSALACGLDHQTKAVKVKYVCDGEIVLSISDRTTDNTYADWSQYVYDNCPEGMTITNTTASAINTLGNVQTLKVTATVEEEPDPEVIIVKEDRKLCGDDVISFEVIGTWDSFTIRANLIEGWDEQNYWGGRRLDWQNGRFLFFIQANYTGDDNYNPGWSSCAFEIDLVEYLGLPPKTAWVPGTDEFHYVGADEVKDSYTVSEFEADNGWRVLNVETRLVDGNPYEVYFYLTVERDEDFQHTYTKTNIGIRQSFTKGYWPTPSASEIKYSGHHIDIEYYPISWFTAPEGWHLVEGMCFRSEQTGGVNIVPVAMWRESDVDHYYTECVVYYSITVVPYPSEEEPELATVRINICEGDGIIHNQWVDGSVKVVNTYEFKYEVGYYYNLADEFDIPSNMVYVNNNGVSNVRFYLHEGVNYINIYVD